MKRIFCYFLSFCLIFFCLFFNVDASESLQPGKTNSLYVLQPGEEFVYGKIGQEDNGSTKYTFVIIRKVNKAKVVFKRERTKPYSGVQPLLGGRVMKEDPNPASYDLYDYWVVFNNEKFGPYDRIYHMQQEEGDVDKWVSSDGKKISFAAVKGNQYFIIIANKRSVYFWSVLQAPDFDPASGHNTFAMQWSEGDFRLFVDDKLKFTKWKKIEKIIYANNKTDLLYVGAETNVDEKYIYLNHQKIAGPYYIVTSLGFIPGTNIPYCAGFGFEEVNGKAIHNYKKVIIGNKSIDIPDGQSVGKFYFAGQWVSFSITKENPAINWNDALHRINISICEYNYVTGELKKMEGYSKVLQTRVVGNTFYYDTNSPLNESLFVKQGGTILYKLSKAETGDNLAIYRINAAGDCYYYYRKSDKTPVKIFKNGTPYTIPVNIAGVELMSFNNSNNALQLVINKDVQVGSKDKRIIYGSKQFDLKGDFSDLNIYFAKQSNDVYSFQRTIVSNNDWRYQVYKNEVPVSNDKWMSITQFIISNDGKRFAALVTDDLNNSSGTYWTENSDMDIKRKLLVDGKILSGNYGAPVWSEIDKSFLVIRESNGNIQLTRL